MVQNSNSIERFWKELKRRKVVHVITVYAAVSFIILQLVDIVEQPLRLPAWTPALVIVLLCIGFIIAVFVSWVYDITPAGVKKTKPIGAAKHFDQSTRPIPSRWKIATYVSAIIIIALLAFNFINKRNLNADISKLEKSIALLPFRNDTFVDSNKYFINGVVEDIRNHLQTIGDLKPTSRTSAEKYINTTKTIPEIGKELGVNYVVEGSGQRSGNKIQLNLHLFRATKEIPLWSKSYVQQIYEATDIFKLESQIAESIAEEIEAVITPLEKQIIEKTPTSNLAAYENYILGMNYMSNYNKEDFNIALQYFEKAIELDPDYAYPYFGTAEVWIWNETFSFATVEEANPIVETNIAKGFDLDSTSSEAYLAKTQALWLSYNFKETERLITQGISVNPNNSRMLVVYSQLLSIIERHNEALEKAKLALKLDPMSISAKTNYAMRLLYSERYNDAIIIFKEILKAEPGNALVLDNLPIALHMDGRYSEELEAWKACYSIFLKGYANVFDEGYAKGGLTGALNLQADSLVKKSKTKFIQPGEIAQIYACAGNKEQTLNMLEWDYEVHDPNFPWLLKFPVFKFIQNEPRFQNLFHKVNLPYRP